MFAQYMLQILGANYESRIIVFDFDNIESMYSYTDLLKEAGFNIIYYKDSVEFRYIYESSIKPSKEKFAVIVDNKEQYVPYDILKSFYNANISWNELFPNLDKDIINKDRNIELPLLHNVYNKSLYSYENTANTNSYIMERLYEKENVEDYLKDLQNELKELTFKDKLTYNEWKHIAAKKGKGEYIAAKSGATVDFSFIDEKFKQFILEEYKFISGIVDSKSPIIVSRVMDFITKNEKIALIILDCMSILDFNIISSKFEGIEYEEDYIYALIPTTTAISRQSLLSGKFPVELDKPFHLSREEREFKAKAKSLGYLDKQICYAKGYDIDIGPGIKCLSIILNDIDSLVHGQQQGRIGMYNDVNFFAQSGKLQKLIMKLYKEGFNIYLVSDHGNTFCKGMGIVKGIGVEVETKSKRMIILKDFAESRELIQKYNLIEYPGYYLDKQYQYLICNTGTSFDTKDSMVMTHGGISIDEVIVPFIKVKAVYYG